MSDRKKQYIAGAIVTIAILTTGLLGVLYPRPATPAAVPAFAFRTSGGGEGYTNFTSLALSEDLYVGNDASIIGDLDAATLDIAGAFDIDGAVTLNSTLDVDGGTTLNSTLDVDGATTLNSTLDVDGNVSSGTGAFTITDSLNVTGAADFDSTLNADGAVTLNSTLDVDGNISSGTGAVTVTDNLKVTGSSTFDAAMTVNANGDFDSLSTLAIDSDSYYDSTGSVQINDNANVTGTLTVAGTLTATGGVVGNLAGNVSGATYVTSTNLARSLTGNVTGYATYQRQLTKTASYTLTAADSGATAHNLGASAELTFTLPTIAASPSYWYCFYVFETYTITIKPAASDQIHALTNAVDNRIQNVGTAGDSVCLLNVNDTYWIPAQKTGTWTDVD